MIKKYFKDWTKFELSFLIIGLSLAILFTIIFKGTIIDMCYTILYFTTALLMSKGKVECYFVGFISVFFYGIVSFNQSYYGELLITILLTFPIMIVGIISWLRNRDKEDNTVIINTLSIKEIIIVLISQIVMFWLYYYILKIFNTSLLIISTCSVVTSVLASYFEARRSELSLISYICNDLILISLWITPVIQGDSTKIPVLLCPTLLLINDIYGTYNWKRLKKKQTEQSNQD